MLEKGLPVVVALNKIDDVDEDINLIEDEDDEVEEIEE